ncbi:HAMP domain-containing sensor histidine kinase [Pedosphaera parvula]|uniref:histidine kinase n=1 Tax=Pedosphaera parvula (strain Ellin514) TaxID=320771 RepID=B9XE95_PEDPL|nr:ATP-binding protein [Pedosphaera parvula]EEF61986.1 integral membrane sensor signal transduction histidine kinase [Pedosphaera parvula Ellin514]
MTIRNRLTLWYASILFASTFLITALAYRELSAERAESRGGSNREAAEEDGPEDVVSIALWCGIPAAVVGLAGGWWLMRKAMNPVVKLTEAASKVHESNLHEKIARSGNGDELDKLTEVFNAMTARLDQSFNRIREFTLHASHELKTPLTVMHGELETALREGTDAGNKERIVSQLDEIQRLTKIVDGLSLLTKADAGLITLKREKVRLSDLVKDCYEDAQILAQSTKVQIELKSCDEALVLGDRHRLRQLLLNLTDNAIKYNQENGSVAIELRAEAGEARLKISNTGPGIFPEMLPRVFDRFFRCDAAHNSAVEGCGLGLSIAQWIVTAHGGRIEMISAPKAITTVMVTLPLHQA